jgi:hypothetical protein
LAEKTLCNLTKGKPELQLLHRRILNANWIIPHIEKPSQSGLNGIQTLRKTRNAGFPVGICLPGI